MPGPRYAIAYTPPPESPLARFGAGVLGYDCYRGVDVPYTAVGGLEPTILRLTTIEVRRSGFHGSFMSPFCLGERTERDLVEATARFARGQRVIPVGPLAVAADAARIVLRPVVQPVELAAFALACREAFVPLRAGTLEKGEAGEPFAFRMTLAGSVPGVPPQPVMKALTAAFAPMAADPLELDAISLMRADDRARLRVLERWRLTGR